MKPVYGNGVNRSNSFNTRLQPQESTDHVTGQSNWALDLQYFWGDNGTQTTNNNGNLRGEKILTWNGTNFSTQNNYSEAFSYDGVNRLHSMTDDGGGTNERDFAYDQFGNMWVSNNTGFNASGTMPVANVYNGANRLNNTNYDAAGNQLNVNGSNMSYDAESKVAQVAEPTSMGGATMTYYYDGEGRRVEKLVNGSASTVYVYDAQGQLAAEYAVNATAAALCQTCYLSTDHLGSTRMVTDGSGHVVARHDYLAFGEEIIGTAGRTSLWGASDAINQKFTGKERDPESGLDYFGARYYGSALGRFTSPDPRGIFYADPSNPESWNLYSYVWNSPLANIDPTGMSCVHTNNGPADDGDGQGCSDAGVKPGNTSDPNTLNQGQINAQATAKNPSDLEYAWTISTHQIPRYDPNDVPLNEKANELVHKVAQNIAGVPDVCSVGGFGYAGVQGEVFGKHGFVGYLGNYDTEKGFTNNGLADVSGHSAGAGAAWGPRSGLEGLAFISAGEAGGAVVGISSEGLTVGGYLGTPESVKGKALPVGAGAGGYITISTRGGCAQQRGW